MGNRSALRHRLDHRRRCAPHERRRRGGGKPWGATSGGRSEVARSAMALRRTIWIDSIFSGMGDDAVLEKHHCRLEQRTWTWYHHHYNRIFAYLQNLIYDTRGFGHRNWPATQAHRRRSRAHSHSGLLFSSLRHAILSCSLTCQVSVYKLSVIERGGEGEEG